MQFRSIDPIVKNTVKYLTSFYCYFPCTGTNSFPLVSNTNNIIFPLIPRIVLCSASYPQRPLLVRRREAVGLVAWASSECSFADTLAPSPDGVVLAGTVVVSRERECHRAESSEAGWRRQERGNRRPPGRAGIRAAAERTVYLVNGVDRLEDPNHPVEGFVLTDVRFLLRNNYDPFVAEYLHGEDRDSSSVDKPKIW